MAITTATDLIAGVLNAATPANAANAAARLGAKDAGAFAINLAELAPTPPAAADDLIADVLAAAHPSTVQEAQHRLAPPAQGSEAEPYRKFEAFLLGSAFETILPPVESGVFGDGYAGGIWRSMAAQQFGSLFADRGGLGLARTLGDADRSVTTDVARSAQWPYFEAAAIGLAQG